MSISPEKIASGRPNPPGLSDTLKRPIVFDGTATPVKTALFLIICIAWLFPGLTGHDPWKPDEAIAMGIVYSMLTENTLQAWLLPQIAGATVNDYAPLYYWVSALTAKLFFVSAADARWRTCCQRHFHGDHVGLRLQIRE